MINKKKVTKVNAVFNLVGGQVGLYDGEITYNDGQTPPTEEAINTELARMQAEYDSLSWERSRQEVYPSIEECVHAILDDDLTALQEKRQAIKTKYPKG